MNIRKTWQVAIIPAAAGIFLLSIFTVIPEFFPVWLFKKINFAAAFDRRGPFTFLISTKAKTAYKKAIEEARTFHPDATLIEFEPAKLESVEAELRNLKPRYAMIFLLPEELDVNLAWKWLALSARIDRDPLVDIRTGFITGESPDSAYRMVRRTGCFTKGEISMPQRMVDNLGPNVEAPEGSCEASGFSFMLPAYMKAMKVTTISHGLKGFTGEKMKLMENAGIIHYGGHGYPDRIVDSLNAVWVRRIKFSPHIFFNGACYTGVTSGWFDVESPSIKQKEVPSENSFCLGVLSNECLGYFAALHPDHGIPVYQEMEYFAFTGAPLGEIMKYTHDGVILASGGNLPTFEEMKDGMDQPSLAPGEIMLKGTASRILFGDPSLRIMTPFASPPLKVSLEKTSKNGEFEAVARPLNLDLKNSFTHTYSCDMSSTGQFNDRVLVTCSLPETLSINISIECLKAECNGKPLPCRLTGYCVEEDFGTRVLHVLVELPSTGYQEGPFRNKNAKVSFLIKNSTLSERRG